MTAEFNPLAEAVADIDAARQILNTVLPPLRPQAAADVEILLVKARSSLMVLDLAGVRT